MTGKKPMRLGIVARDTYRGTGVERFQEQTVPYLLENIRLSEKIPYHFSEKYLFSTTIGKIKLGRKLQRIGEQYEKIFIPAQDMVLFDVDKVDAEIVVYVHDVFPVTTNFSGWFASNLGKYYTHQLEKLDHVIVPSVHTKLDLMNRTSYDGYVSVVPQGVDGLPSKWVDSNVHRDIDLLYVGGSHGRKNFGLVEEVFKQATAKGFKCVAVTDRDMEHGYVRSNVSDEDLAYLYRSSRYYLHPSKQEGFGRPPLEAQRYGSVVLGLDNRINQEIMQGSFLTVETVDDILYQLEQEMPEEMRDTSRINAAKYEWIETRMKLVEALK